MISTNELFRRKLCQYRSLGCPRDALSVESNWHTLSVLVHTRWLILIRHTAMLRQSQEKAQLHDRFAGFHCLSDVLRGQWPKLYHPSKSQCWEAKTTRWPRAKGQIWTRKSSCFERLAHPSILIILLTSFPSCTRCMTFMKQSILTCRTHSDPYPQAQGWQAGKADFFQARPWKLVLMNMNVLNGIWIIKRIEIKSAKSYHHKSQFGLTRCPGHESWDHPEFSL